MLKLKNIFLLHCLVLFISPLCVGRNENYRTNVDFLSHEIGSIGTKRDYVAPDETNTAVNIQNNQRKSTVGHQVLNSTLRPYTSSRLQSTSTTQPISTHRLQQSSGKRDYVARNFTTPKPVTQATPNQSTNSGKVKDLINLYESKNKNQPNPQYVPSYSSILKSNNRDSMSVTTVKPPNSQGNQKRITSTQKPLSFSAVVAGNKGSTQPGIHATGTSKAPSDLETNKLSSSTTRKPGTTLNLPSSLNNQNKHSNNNKNNGNTPTDTELETVSEELLRKDTNNAAKYVTINYQEKTTSQSKDDKAPQPLLTIAPEVWNISTIQKFMPLLDNYVRDTLVNEYVTPMERNEENIFMDAIMSTTVIRHLMNFLVNKGYATPDPRQQKEYLKQMWFNLYSRGKGKLSSSGFEHVFVSELRDSEVLGLHNWIYFAREEAQNRVNYLGYLKYVTLGDKGAVLKLHFTQEGADKPVDTMFIGTSPELEMALYTLCFVTRADNECNLKLGTKDVNIKTHTFRYRSKNHIGSAFPQI